MTDVDQLSNEIPTAPEGSTWSVTRRRSRWWWVLLAVLLGAGAGAGLALWDNHRQQASAAPLAATTTTVAPAAGLSIPSGLISGGTSTKRPPTHLIDNRVFIVGDSVMQGAAPYIAPDLPGWAVIADTKVGRFLDEANVVITKRAKDIGKIAVLNLGNNYNGSQAQFAQQVDTALTELAGVEHIIWIDAAEFQDDRTQVNAVLTQAASTHPNLTIVDWNSWWAANRSFTGADHLHLTDEGAKAYAALVAAAVKQVTDAAGELPLPGAAKPSINTSGTIPRSAGASPSGSSSRSRTRTTVRHAATTAGSSGTVPPVTAPPVTVPTTDTAPKVTAPKVTVPATSPAPTTPSG